ncbi:hypothetical protein RRG08_002103 [Elysia crispata]|uniref:Uncharacterized protein n=1 Tax=Elysia crispata TaxID=231223 RepID=A0AAE0ZKU7_9GAST|nr:hypothetical protein RRG08_002103 [Elysia crispata]
MDTCPSFMRRPTSNVAVRSESQWNIGSHVNSYLCLDRPTSNVAERSESRRIIGSRPNSHFRLDRPTSNVTVRRVSHRRILEAALTVISASSVTLRGESQWNIESRPENVVT